MLSFKQFINIKENTVSSGDIRGLGGVTGNPAGDITNWTLANMGDADTRDNILKALIKSMHTDLHKKNTAKK